MWVLLSFISAVCLGCYDISKKIALRDNGVVDVLTVSVLISSGMLIVPLLLSRLAPGIMVNSPFYVPHMNVQGHLFTLVKSAIVLSSWVFAYISLKHLPISMVSPWQATRPMWTLMGAMIIFGERLNIWQWAGVILAIGSIFLFSFHNRISGKVGDSGFIRTSHLLCEAEFPYYVCLGLAILIGACSGLYDKFIMRHYDHNAVQVYYTLYQAVMMIVVYYIHHRSRQGTGTEKTVGAITNLTAIGMISVFLVISDNVYMLALQHPDSMIAIVSTIRRGGTVIAFAYGLLFLKENDPWRKLLCMLGIIMGLICLAMGTR